LLVIERGLGMLDDLNFSEKMRWSYLWTLNKFFKSPPSHQEIDTKAEAQVVDPHSTAGRGMCLIVFPGVDKPDYCRNGMTNRDCQDLASSVGGFARPVIPGSVCAQ
jgi:hypothetical protein